MPALHAVENLFELIEEHQLLLARSGRPVPQHRGDDLGCERGVLLEELRDAIAELRVEHCDMAHLVQGEEHLDEELLVLVLEREREAVDDGAENLEQLRDAIVAVGFVDEAEENVVDGATDEGAKGHEVAVDTVQNGLQVVALARILRVKELEETQHKGLAKVLVEELGVCLGGSGEAKEELVDDLKVHPVGLGLGLVLLWVELALCLVRVRRERAEEVVGEHLKDVRELVLRKGGLEDGKVADELEQCGALDLLVLGVLLCVAVLRGLEYVRAQPQLLAE